MNSPLERSRFVHVFSPITFDRSWLRFRTAPFRALSPTGLFDAISMIRFVVVLFLERPDVLPVPIELEFVAWLTRQSARLAPV